jgi:phage/plasmid-associated DNA primase
MEISTLPGKDDVGKRVTLAAKKYVTQNSWVLIPLSFGDKMPTDSEWSSPANCISPRTVARLDKETIYGVGLAHAYSGTVSVDIDSLARAAPLFADGGVDLKALLNAPDAVKIISGREDRAKLIYRLPKASEPLPSIKRDSDGYELRCATKNGTTLQDVLPPSVHPGTKVAYRWEGDPFNVPLIPDELLAFWVGILNARKDRKWKTSGLALMEPMVMSALESMDPDRPYNEWLEIGMALDSYELGDLWDEWSATGTKYVPGDCESRLSGFTEDGGITLATFWHYAIDEGWDSKQAWKDCVKWILDNEPDPSDAIKKLSEAKRACKPDDSSLALARKEFTKHYAVPAKAFDSDLRRYSIDQSGSASSSLSTELTHWEIADHYYKSLGNAVTAEGQVWTFKSKVWKGTTMDTIRSELGEIYKSQRLCKNGASYRQVADLVLLQNVQQDFFQQAKPGLNCLDGFYVVEDGKINKKPQLQEHYQRHYYEVAPRQMDTPLFRSLLGSMAYESQELLQEFIGVCLFKLATKYQKAMLLYGDPSSGKSTLLNLLDKIFAPYVSNVEPRKMWEDYHIARLPRMLINIRAELPGTRSIDSEHFKAIISGDRIAAREVAKPVFEFRPIAGHIFSANVLPTVANPETAFWRRWLLTEWTRQKDIVDDVNLVEKIHEKELEGVFWWALMGAERVINNGGYSKSKTHERLLDQWKGEHNVVKRCLHAEDSPFVVIEGDDSVRISVVEFAKTVQQWQLANNEEPAHRKDIIALGRGLFQVKKPKNREIFLGIGIALND